MKFTPQVLDRSVFFLCAETVGAEDDGRPDIAAAMLQQALALARSQGADDPESYVGRRLADAESDLRSE